MKKGSNILLSTIVSVVVVLIFFMVQSSSLSGEKTAYIKLGEVYESFTLTKELNTKFETVRNQRKLILDSLGIQINNLGRAIQEQKAGNKQIGYFEKLRQNYQYKKQEFEQDNQALQDKYNEQIMNQLNQYIRDYGKQQGYSYIYGANGNGSIMYAQKALDISEEISEYVNHKYEGKK